MKESGNGTAAIQALYLMVNLPFIHLVKIGISGNVKNRRKNISETTPGLVFPILIVVIPFAWHVEQSMHRVFRRFNAPFGKSASGHSEWFISLVAPFAAAVMLFWQLFWLAVVCVVALFITWMAADFPKEPIRALTRLFF